MKAQTCELELELKFSSATIFVELKDGAADGGRHTHGAVHSLLGLQQTGKQSRTGHWRNNKQGRK
jgi:hypothetical protein